MLVSGRDVDLATGEGQVIGDEQVNLEMADVDCRSRSTKRDLYVRSGALA